MKEALNQLREVHAIQGRDGCWDIDDYMLGLYNGLELALSIVESRACKYKQRPKSQSKQEPVAWVYPEGLEALKAGKPWTAYGTRQEPNNTALYLSPQPDILPYAWVTFTPYGDEDDDWYENPEGQLLEGWTYKPLYDTTPPQRPWVGLTDDEIGKLYRDGWSNNMEFARAIEAKLRSKNG